VLIRGAGSSWPEGSSIAWAFGLYFPGVGADGGPAFGETGVLTVGTNLPNSGAMRLVNTVGLSPKLVGLWLGPSKRRFGGALGKETRLCFTPGGLGPKISHGPRG